jgi:hydroxymethylpyrimidine kinase/phosphomethylpyrimidine kinase
MKITNEEDMRRAAALMRGMGARAVLVKGGHLAGDALDLLDDEGHVQLFRAPRIASDSTHGTGCTLAAAIAACLARGLGLAESVAVAKRFVTAAIRSAPGLGRGFGPVRHDITVRFTDAGVLIDEG